MNGNEPQVEIFGPFGEAFEWMKKILFQPFEFQKWLVIGFAAFLANLSGGANVNFPKDFGKGDWSFRSMSHDATGSTDWLTSCAVPLLVIAGILVVAIIVVLLWVGSRGRFIFTDCIVRNRAAIAEPWREYRREGNSFFLFSLIVGLVLLTIIAIAAVPVLIPYLQGWTEGAALFASLTVGIVLLAGVVFLITAAWSLISQLMVPVMYRQRCRALVAFRQIVGLIRAHPGPLVLYLLFFFVLALAVIMVSCLAVPLTCCIAAIPYVGTVILLPVYVVLAAFPLFFLRQFGPEYDVWGTIERLESPSPDMPPSQPQPPLEPPSTPTS
ncbi:MAG TPA: hypothetical protein VNP98_04470 [Chthoniobacterales bacterium]|nr:hypothetical protein [Chthoniobacterales bacterium]